MVTRDGRSAGLQPDDWIEAALQVIAAGGIAAVSVEGLARRLQATKGSFYWHFKDRAALISAALVVWEQRDTDDVIAALGSIGDPREQLASLLGRAFTGASVGVIELTLLADADDPVVGASLRRVAATRLAFVEDLFQRLGVPDPKERALIAFSAFVGFTHLRRTSSELVPRDQALRDYVRTLTDQLLAD